MIMTIGILNMQAQTINEISDHITFTLGYDFGFKEMADDYSNVASRSGGLAQLEYAFETPKLDLLLSGTLRIHGFNDLAAMQSYYADHDLSLVKYSKGSLTSTGLLIGAKFHLNDATEKLQTDIFAEAGPAMLFQSEILATFETGLSHSIEARAMGFQKQIGVEIEPFHSDTFSGAFRIGILNENGDLPVQLITTDDNGVSEGVEIIQWRSTSLFVSFACSFEL